MARRGTDRRRADGVEPGSDEAVGEDGLKPLASFLLTSDSAYARWRASLSRTVNAVAGGALGVGGSGTARRIHLPNTPATSLAPCCRCLFPAQPSTGALVSSSTAARRGRGSRVEVQSRLGALHRYRFS